MWSHKRSGPDDVDTNQGADSVDDLDDMDMMCLVYPDGRTRNVSAQQDSSDD